MKVPEADRDQAFSKAMSVLGWWFLGFWPLAAIGLSGLGLVLGFFLGYYIFRPIYRWIRGVEEGDDDPPPGGYEPIPPLSKKQDGK